MTEKVACQEGLRDKRAVVPEEGVGLHGQEE